MLRINIHGKDQILMGDSTSHGGVVITGSTTAFVDGIPIARKGDKVFCPKCKPHIFEVSEGLANATDTDARLPIALDGHLTSCGVKLKAGAASHAMLMTAYSYANGIDTPVSVTKTENDQFDQHFCLSDKITGEPIANCFYSLTANGQIIYGRTDASGHTVKITADQELDAEIEIIELAQQESTDWLKD